MFHEIPLFLSGLPTVLCALTRRNLPELEVFDQCTS
jgi:hypothetical protein